MLQDLRDRGFSACPPVQTLNKQHGCSERRRYWIKDISAPQWDANAALYGRQRAIRVEREQHHVKSGQASRQAMR